MVLTKEEEAFIKRKHDHTLKLRSEYLKQSSNPFRHATGEGGTVVCTIAGYVITVHIINTFN